MTDHWKNLLSTWKQGRKILYFLVVTVGIHWASNSDDFIQYVKHGKTKAYLLSLHFKVNSINLNLSLGYQYIHLLKKKT